jgi:hypothetical protein
MLTPSVEETMFLTEWASKKKEKKRKKTFFVPEGGCPRSVEQVGGWHAVWRFFRAVPPHCKESFGGLTVEQKAEMGDLEFTSVLGMYVSSLKILSRFCLIFVCTFFFPSSISPSRPHGSPESNDIGSVADAVGGNMKTEVGGYMI